MRTTDYTHLAGDPDCIICGDEHRTVARIRELYDQHPDKVKIIYTPSENHGVIYAKVPWAWVKIVPPGEDGGANSVARLMPFWFRGGKAP